MIHAVIFGIKALGVQIDHLLVWRLNIIGQRGKAIAAVFALIIEDFVEDLEYAKYLC